MSAWEEYPVDLQRVLRRAQYKESARGLDGKRMIPRLDLQAVSGGGGWTTGLNVAVVRPTTFVIPLRDMSGQFIPNLAGITI